MMMDKRLLKEIPQAKKYIFLQVFVQWCALLTNIAIVMLMANLLQTVAMQNIDASFLLVQAMIMLAMILLRMLFTLLQTKYSYLASKDVKYHLRKRIFDTLWNIRMRYRRHVSTSELVQLSVEGVDQLEIYFGRYLPQFFYSMLAPITLFLIFVWMDAGSVFVLLLCVPLIPFSIIVIQKFAKRLLSKYWSSYANLGDSFLENLQGLTTLKIYQADESRHQRMNVEAEQFRKITMKVLIMQLNSVTVMDIVAYGGAALGSVLAVLHYMDGSLDLFGMICIALLSAEFFLPLRLLGSYFHIAMNGIAASDKIFRFLALDKPATASQTLNKDEICVSLDRVAFAYEKEKPILKQVTLTLHPHQFIAVVGESGCGKSTLAKLLMGWITADQGSVQFQGKLRQEIEDRSFFEQVMYVTHQPFLAQGSVYDNLKMGNANASKQDMLEVLKKVQLYDFIMAQQGLDTMVKEGGSNFSGGQRQRLALARALLQKRQVYIFDEATSNIDVESEELILSIIQELAKESSVIIITHRLQSIVGCDQIYFMKQGEILEQGNHEALMKQKHYAQLFLKQQELEAYRSEGSI